MSEHLDTLAIHGGTAPDPTTKARITPIYQTSSYVFDDVDHAARLFNLEEFGNIYSRLMNPTNDVLEKKIAALEGGVAGAGGGIGPCGAVHRLPHADGAGLPYRRGRAAFMAARSTRSGTASGSSAGRRPSWTQTISRSVAAAITDKTRCLFIESLANPGGVVQDIAAIAKIAHDAGVPLIVDNTLATPMLCRPIEHGADIVVHSTTKFLNGHGNSIGGVIVDSGRFDWAASDKYPSLTTPNPSYHDMVFTDALAPVGPIAFIIGCRVLGLRDLGPAMAPMNAFLTLTGMETLALRMERHCSNALALAEWLQKHPKVDWVSYAGAAGRQISCALQRYLGGRGGAVFTFGVKGGYEAGKTLVNSVKLFSLLANIGDTRSLIIHPSSTTHRQLSEAEQVEAGAGPDVVRVSVGIEHIDDIIADLAHALDQI